MDTEGIRNKSPKNKKINERKIFACQFNNFMKPKELKIELRTRK